MKNFVSIALVMGALSLGASCGKEDKAAGPAAASAKAADPAAAPAPAAPTAIGAGGEAAAAEVGEISVELVASLLATDGCTAIDANSATTRKTQGAIPGATLLSHYTNYDLSELPADKQRKLVFYCANQSCGASHKSAEKALLAGYTDVAVLPAGIAGWREAGRDVTTVQ